MPPDADRILKDALQLPDSQRADLAARLIESLDEPFEDEVESAWREEVERRVDEMDAGLGKSIPWPEARRRILGLKGDASAA